MKWLTLETKIKIFIVVLVCVSLLAVSSAIYNWYADRFKPVVSQKEYVATPEIKKVEKMEEEKP